MIWKMKFSDDMMDDGWLRLNDIEGKKRAIEKENREIMELRANNYSELGTTDVSSVWHHGYL